MDEVTPAVLKTYEASNLQAAMENLEVAIFDSPPFEKVNEQERRKSLAYTYWLMGDPIFYPRMIPNAKEALRQVKGEDAELQYMLGAAMLSCMESEASQEFAVIALKRAIELKPDFPEAKAALARAAGAPPVPKSVAAPSPPPPAPSAPVTEKASGKKSKASKAKTSEPLEGAPPAGFTWGATY